MYAHERHVTPTKEMFLDNVKGKKSSLMMELLGESEQCLLTVSRLVWETLKEVMVQKIVLLPQDKLKNHKKEKIWVM